MKLIIITLIANVYLLITLLIEYNDLSSVISKQKKRDKTLCSYMLDK